MIKSSSFNKYLWSAHNMPINEMTTGKWQWIQLSLLLTNLVLNRKGAALKTRANQLIITWKIMLKLLTGWQCLKHNSSFLASVHLSNPPSCSHRAFLSHTEHLCDTSLISWIVSSSTVMFPSLSTGCVCYRAYEIYFNITETNRIQVAEEFFLWRPGSLLWKDVTKMKSLGK